MKKLFLVILLLTATQAQAQTEMNQVWEQLRNSPSIQGVNSCDLTGYIASDTHYLYRTGSAVHLPFMPREVIRGLPYPTMASLPNLDVLWMPESGPYPGTGFIVLVFYGPDGMAREIIMLNDTLP